jgi:GAF domain-containing protein
MNFEALMVKARKILTMEEDESVRLYDLCLLLKDEVPHYDWVGFYMAIPHNRELVLGPFVGEDTDHVRIPYGKGICGQAAEREETFVVQDVTARDNYLACSLKVKSEIVVPVFRNGKVVAEIDIDSHAKNPFTEEDRQFLENLAKEVAPLI